MGIQKKITLCAAVLLLLGLCAVFLLPKEERNSDAAMRIGAGDDSSGYLLAKILEQAPLLAVQAQQEEDVEAYTFQDC